MLLYSGSPTWTRTKDLRINRTGLPKAYGHQVEETQRVFQHLPPWPSRTDLIPRQYGYFRGIAGEKLMHVKGVALPNADPTPTKLSLPPVLYGVTGVAVVVT